MAWHLGGGWKRGCGCGGDCGRDSVGRERRCCDGVGLGGVCGSGSGGNCDRGGSRGRGGSCGRGVSCSKRSCL